MMETLCIDSPCRRGLAVPKAYSCRPVRRSQSFHLSSLMRTRLGRLRAACDLNHGLGEAKGRMVTAPPHPGADHEQRYRRAAPYCSGGRAGNPT